MEFLIGQSISIVQQAQTNNVTLDLTSATIATQISSSVSGYVINIASSDVSQIKIATGTAGLFTIYVTPSESSLLVKGIWKVKSTITIGSNIYIVESSFAAIGNVNENYSIYTIDKTKSVTYAELQTLIANDLLIPSGKYLITDFAETWTGHTTSTAEPLVVTALTVDSLELIAFSTTNPLDYIEYSVTSNNYISGSTKGEIIKRRTNSTSNIIVKGYNNTFGTNCINNTFDGASYNNTFGNSCSSNLFLYSVTGCTFSNNVKNNIFECALRSIDFTSATYTDIAYHLSAAYQCHIKFKRGYLTGAFAGGIILEFIDVDGQLNIVETN